MQDEVKHEMVLNFPYMNHVINETLRMYPAVLRWPYQLRFFESWSNLFL